MRAAQIPLSSPRVSFSQETIVNTKVNGTMGPLEKGITRNGAGFAGISWNVLTQL